jgi:phospho-N-acetylmuramoyl-pentapeptide-transferase
MIYHLLAALVDAGYLRINPFQYITVRCVAAGVVALLISWAVGPRLVAVLRLLKAGQPIRTVSIKGAPDLAEMHGKKAGTPTMGGVLIVFSVLVPVLLWCNLFNPLIWLLIFVTFGYGTIGFLDDYLKITQKNADGLSPKQKILGQLLVGLVVGGYLWYFGDTKTLGVEYSYYERGILNGPWTGYDYLQVPFFKSFYPYIGLFFIPYVMLVLTSTSNAVNLTDGLDGLCIGITFIVTAAFMLLAYLCSNKFFSEYLMMVHVPKADEVVVFMGALFGACLGFLWFNAYPADMFMGDTGSLTLGGVIGTVAVICKQEILFVVIGGVFVLEAASVVIQVMSYKLTKRRVFLMAPLHHHFERKGMTEAKIIARFWIVSILFAIVGLSMLKLR